MHIHASATRREGLQRKTVLELKIKERYDESSHHQCCVESFEISSHFDILDIPPKINLGH
jgi:hypothetical protein